MLSIRIELGKFESVYPVIVDFFLQQKLFHAYRRLGNVMLLKYDVKDSRIHQHTFFSHFENNPYLVNIVKMYFVVSPTEP